MYPGHHHHSHHHQQRDGEYGGYAPPPGGPPGFPAPGPGFRDPGFGDGYAPPPGPPGGDYGGGYAPPPGPPGGGYGGGYVPPPGQPPPGNSPYGGYDGGGYGGGYPPPSGPPMDSYGSYSGGGGGGGGGGGYMPPPGRQDYGPGGMDGAQPFFQYSQCNGRKKALCIGINYFGQKSELKGCINDAHNVRRFLSQHGYDPDDIVLLTDDSQNFRQIPTKQNIMEAIQWLVRDANPNDSIFFHYSGHGGQTKDLDGDEADGYDEVIYPVDYQDAGQIVDDDIFFTMVAPLPPGCRLTAIFDSCHSGSVCDLPYIYSTEGKIKEPNLAAEAGMGLMNVMKSYAQKDMGGVFQGAMGLFKTATGRTQKAEEYARRTRTSPADAISWSGCKDSQTSADTVEAGAATGAMSYAFITCLTQKPQQTYQELLVNLRAILRDKYSQKPQLSSSHPMDTNIMFIF